VQRVYGQTPFAIVRNSHCEPCVGCTKNCYDLKPHAAQIADLNDDSTGHAAYRKLFVGAFPGFVVAFYVVDIQHGWGVLEMYGKFGVLALASLGSFLLLRPLLRVTWSTIAVVYGAAALNAFYWFNVPEISRRIADTAPTWIVWPSRSMLLALTIVWIARSWKKERRFLAEVAPPPPMQVGRVPLAVISTTGARSGASVADVRLAQFDRAS
jgi:hypothetical protein